MEVYRNIVNLIGYDGFHVIFCSESESNREWDFDCSGFSHSFLKKSVIVKNGRYIHSNIDVIKELRKHKAEIVITTGFNPTHLFAFAYSVVTGCQHIPMTDGTLESEKRLSIFHKAIRRLVYSMSNSFIGASNGSFDLYRSYGIADELITQSHLCANNIQFNPNNGNIRQYDLMFSGRFVEDKSPLFALDSAAEAAKKLNRKLSILMIGNGPLHNAAIEKSNTLSAYIDVNFAGHLKQGELPAAYQSSKILLLPSVWEPWGVVVNEACAAGQAVILTPEVGAVDIVKDGINGFVLNMDTNTWSDAICKLLSDSDLLDRFSKNSINSVSNHTFSNAAKGIVSAIYKATMSHNHILFP